MTLNSDLKTSLLSNSAIGLLRWLRKRPIAILTIFALITSGSVIGLASDDSKTTSPQKQSKIVAEDAIPVVVAPVVQDVLDIYLFGLGVVTPLNTVEVSSRVDGQLMSIDFDDGQMVKSGDLLARIDPQPFEVELELAKGQVVRDQALLDKALVDINRYRTLLKQDSISVQLVETKESLVRQYQAAVQAGQARVTNANLQLRYAYIKAPISGRVGFRKVSPGNILHASDSNGIVMITQLDPISVIFPIPEDHLPKVMKLLNSGNHIAIDIYDRAMKEIIGKGRLVAADNQIDATTGTIKLKAELPNGDGSLFANQFVNVRMSIETQPDAILLPTAAIQRGTNGAFVYIVNQNLTVAVTPVKLGPSQGKDTAIIDGVTPGQIVVIEGADRLRNDANIKIIEREKTVSETGGR